MYTKRIVHLDINNVAKLKGFYSVISCIALNRLEKIYTPFLSSNIQAEKTLEYICNNISRIAWITKIKKKKDVKNYHRLYNSFPFCSKKLPTTYEFIMIKKVGKFEVHRRRGVYYF